MDINTLGDLTRVTRRACWRARTLAKPRSKRSGVLNAKGLRIGQSLEEGGHHEKRFRPPATLSPQEQAILNKLVSELNLSVRARKCMNRLDITTLGELIQRSGDELLEAKNFGVTSLSEVREKISAMGLKLRGE